MDVACYKRGHRNTGFRLGEGPPSEIDGLFLTCLSDFVNFHPIFACINYLFCGDEMIECVNGDEVKRSSSWSRV